MNDIPSYLNSLLLEGKISEDPIMKMALGEERTELRVESNYSMQYR